MQHQAALDTKGSEAVTDDGQAYTSYTLLAATDLLPLLYHKTGLEKTNNFVLFSDRRKGWFTLWFTSPAICTEIMPVFLPPP